MESDVKVSMVDVIAISGYKDQCGKSTLAQSLYNEALTSDKYDNVFRLSFARPLKEIASVILGDSYYVREGIKDDSMGGYAVSWSPRQLLKEIAGILRSHNDEIFCEIMKVQIELIRKLHGGHSLIIIDDLRYGIEEDLLNRMRQEGVIRSVKWCEIVGIQTDYIFKGGSHELCENAHKILGLENEKEKGE